MAIGDEQWIQEQLAQLATQRPAAMPTGSPDDGTRPSWTGLLGNVFGGGQSPGYKLRGSEADTAGNKALLNFGINMLLASGPAPVRPDLLSAAATGLQGAQQSMDLDQRRAQAAALAQYGAAREQRQDQLAALKEALPLLQLQRDQAALANLKNPRTTNTAAVGGDPGFTGDKAKDLALIAKRESGGDPTALNYVAKEDPTAYERGATASGKYQIVNSTWADGMRLAGLDPSKYVTARSAPEAVQDQVASALYDKYGAKPWQKGARDWVKGADGRYQLATVRPGAAAAPGGPPAASGTPPPYQVATAGNAVPPAPGGAPGAPGATVPRETQVRGADGVVRTVVQPVPAVMPPARTASVEPETGLPVAGGPGAAPAPVVAPGAAPVAPAPAPAMATPPPFQMRPLTPTEAAATSYALDPQTEKSFADRLQASVTVPEALAVKKERDTALEARRNAADTARATIERDERKTQTEIWQKQQEQRNAIEAERIKQEAAAAQALKLEAQKAKAAQDLEMTKSENSYVLKERERFGIERDSTRSSIDNLQTMQILSDAAGRQTPLEGINLPGGGTGRDLMVKMGVGTQAEREHWGAAQAFNAAKNQMIIELRKGVSMGALSDRDLSFLQGMGPELMNDPSTRREMIALLENAQQHKRSYMDKVEELWDEGKGMSWAKAKREADKAMPKMIPDLPTGYSRWKPDEQMAWNRSNLRPGQIVRQENGVLGHWVVPQQPARP